MKKRCTICRQSFTPGVNGIMNPVLCDMCAKIKRDASGYAWDPNETEHTYEDVGTGEISLVTRAQAFGDEA